MKKFFPLILLIFFFLGCSKQYSGEANIFIADRAVSISAMPGLNSEKAIAGIKERGRDIEASLKEQNQALKKITDFINGEIGKFGLKADFDAVVMGYIVDECIKIMKKNSVPNAMIDGEGRIFCLGKKKAEPWRIGIRDPLRPEAPIGFLKVSDLAVSTKIIPIKEAKNNVVGVTVTAKNCALADGLSAVFFKIPAEESLKIADKINGVGCLIITLHGNKLHFHQSERVKERLFLRDIMI